MRIGTLRRRGGGFKLPQPFADDRQSLLEIHQPLAGAAEPVPEVAVLVLNPARADAEDQPPARDVVDRSSHVGQKVRVPVGGAGDKDPEPGPLRDLGDCSK